ncbi:uncharacterized protein AMSG_08298 [Thecamonas trahens ATCC 50062]|uniref:Protein phosphatase inhibitor 2 n=1 Tax=Thecamonas trahens ATCC 50062 TaxID=461836 RepID=A0A0L0DJF0_THETB|nr:hypothetical protein AMSG_08298 [Thecamonas trahens ATCC 50062]KNC52330.1 hypothetical protein AMSG_08298 [Thecamonas trahens ATCC 50062]|eukprot:XP_013755381.1 hypothetical protein AMSG_08298 [Thecamonas trahens ATCC 50062]
MDVREVTPEAATKPVTKGILKREHGDEAGANEGCNKKRKGIVWDEENLAYNEENKSATMKIEEPDTPYHNYNMEDDDEVRASGALAEDGEGKAVRGNTAANAGLETAPPPPAVPQTQQLESQAASISEALAHVGQTSATPEAEQWEEAPVWTEIGDDDDDDDEVEEDPEEVARRKAEFERRRKAHYKMEFKPYNPNDDEDDDE